VAGIIQYGSYVPYYRLSRESIGAGRGERAAASYDEDSVSMAVEAAREGLRGRLEVDALLFATSSPPYAEKLNAATLQAALGLPASTRSLDLGGSTRMGLGALLCADDVARSGGRALACASDVVVGAPGGGRERDGGDAACAFVVGSDAEAVARIVGRASTTTEVLDVYRIPEDAFAHQWEERFGAEVLAPVLIDTAGRALAAAGLEAKELACAIVDSSNARAAAALPRALGLSAEQLADPLAASVGRAGCAHAGLLLARALDRAKPGDRILALSGVDGCDALVVEVSERIRERRPLRAVDHWIESRQPVEYLAYLKWRGVLPFEPPRRPDPERPAAPPMQRAGAWKLHFVGSHCTRCGTGHLPPQRVCVACRAVDQMEPKPFADVPCKVATFTIDRLAYSLQPPVVAAVVDYEGGGRFQCELTDVNPADVAIGNELEMTFRRLFTAQGVHNYFWKARPIR
jgi:3-hydroxy-3-methylglutaryl CoA synthase